MRNRLQQTNNWRQVRGFPNYLVSSHGRVRSLLSGLVLKPWKIRGRYPEVGLRRNGATYKRLTHRLAAEAFGSLPRGSEIDYRRNRVASHAEILRGIGPTAEHTSSYKGVSYSKRARRWYACIKVDGRTRGLGLFADEVAAAKTYDAVARKLWGSRAYQNFRRA
jgi:hypothetical protein